VFRGDLVDQAAQMRLSGHPYRRIGAELGLSARGAWKAVQRAIAGGGPLADQIRAHELGQLEQRQAHLDQRRAELVGVNPEGTQ
jgi:hypothetical protein